MASNSKPAVQIRAAKDSDLNRILEIERASPTAAHWPHSDYASALTSTSPPRTLLLAELDAQVEAFLVARSLHPAEWEIENVVVAETARRRGVGLALVNAFLEQVRLGKPLNQDVAIYLEVRESNLAARQLYEKSGFHLDNRRTAYYTLPKEDAVLYRYMFQ